MASPLVPFQTHPSVRVKGTENNFNPVQCVDMNCMNKGTPHLHCPFCVKTDFYQDPVILKAHYRVKHVDKGAEFAGLKILRCCDRCYVVGSIKGEKVFKGPHWHCYKCRNGFNRRDEALKHYKTHFRNPQTTFQIQIAQDVNPAPQLVSEGEQAAAAQTLTQADLLAVQPTLAEVIDIRANTQVLAEIESSQGNERTGQEQVLVSVAANETVETPETIMIIQEKIDDVVTNGMEDGSLQIAVSEADRRTSHDGIQLLANQASELDEKNRQLQEEQAINQRLQEEVMALRAKVESQARELEIYKQREQELLDQLAVPIETKVQELLQKLQADHTQMLHHHLLALKRSLVRSMQEGQQQHTVHFNIHEESTDQEGVETKMEAGRQGQVELVEMVPVMVDPSSSSTERVQRAPDNLQLQEQQSPTENTSLADSNSKNLVLDINSESASGGSISVLVRKRKREHSPSEDTEITVHKSDT